MTLDPLILKDGVNGATDGDWQAGSLSLLCNVTTMCGNEIDELSGDDDVFHNLISQMSCQLLALVPRASN